MNKQFTVMNHEYISTGGHCMVSIFTIYDGTAKATRYVLVDENGVNLTTFDYISNELPDGLDYEDVIINSHTWEALTCEPSFDQQQIADEEHELFKYCQFEFIKKDCKYFKTKRRMSVDQLPNELFRKLSAHCVQWHQKEGVDFLTDGYEVYPDSNYTPEESVVDERLQAAVEFEKRVKADSLEFNEYLTELFNEGLFTDDTAERFLSEALLIVGGKVLKIPMHADTFELIQTFVDKVAES